MINIIVTANTTINNIILSPIPENTGIPESFCAKPVLIGFNTPTVNPTTVPHKAMAVAVIES